MTQQEHYQHLLNFLAWMMRTKPTGQQTRVRAAELIKMAIEVESIEPIKPIELPSIFTSISVEKQVMAVIERNIDTIGQMLQSGEPKALVADHNFVHCVYDACAKAMPHANVVMPDAKEIAFDIIEYLNREQPR